MKITDAEAKISAIIEKVERSSGKSIGSISIKKKRGTGFLQPISGNKSVKIAMWDDD